MHGKIWYDIWNEEAQSYDCILKETYEEALGILDDENAICIHNDDQS
jgi:hypothetical protein